jgi:hypothetical protein
MFVCFAVQVVLNMEIGRVNWALEILDLDEAGAARIVAYSKEHLKLFAFESDPSVFLNLNMDVGTINTICSALELMPMDVEIASLLEIFRAWMKSTNQGKIAD